MSIAGIKAVDEYLSSCTPGQQHALSGLRTLIRSIVPEAIETINYGIPMFLYQGNLVGFGAAKKHCSFFVGNGSLIESMKKELVGYDTSKGTIRFVPHHPLPVELVTTIVQRRMRENTAADKQKK
ncbi:MAG: DUF1801 domain-containing protein [Candidatus Absconditabacterales bacterium]